MRHELIQAHLDAATAAAMPSDLERVLNEARAELSESEYLALQGQLSSAGNLAAEQSGETIRILKHKPDRWSRVDLLQIGWGRVQVEDDDGSQLWIYPDDIHPDDRQAIAWGTITAPADPQFTEPSRSFEEFTLTLTRAELTSLNRGLNCWLAELRASKTKAQGDMPLTDQSLEIASGVCRRVDKLLGII